MKQQIFNYAVLLLLIASTFYAGRAYERQLISNRILSEPEFGTDSDYAYWDYIINNKKYNEL
jgi:hypothetical protein